MRQVAIVTDTTACVPQEPVARYEIEVVPVQLIIEGRVYRDGIDISPAEFYTRLRQSPKAPTTSSSAPEPYLEAYRRASRRVPNVLCLTPPAHFSAMFNSARLAMETARQAILGVGIEVLECTTAAAGQGLVTLSAARAAEAGKTLQEVIAAAKNTMSCVHLFATLDTLQYLARSGRVPQAAAMVNSLLNIKPIFALEPGGARTVALPRTTESAIKRMLKLMEAKVVAGKVLRVAVMHADAPEEAAEIGGQVQARFNPAELFITEFTPVMGVHTGPGLIGIAFYNEG